MKLFKDSFFFGTRHREKFDSNVTSAIAAGTAVLRFGRFQNTKAVLGSFMTQYYRIIMDFQQEGGENFPAACFYETKQSAHLGYLTKREDAILNWLWVKNRPGDDNISGTNKLTERPSNANSIKKDRIVSAIRRICQQIRDPDPIAPGLQPPSVQVNNEKAAFEPQPQDPTPPVPPGLRVLALGSDLPKELDGGGIRGLFAIIILQHIMEEVRKLDCPDNDDSLKPCEYFDLIGSTSTGGLLGIMLGRLRMDLVSCQAAYKTLSSVIFKRSTWSVPGKQLAGALIPGTSWNSEDALKSAVQDIVSERLPRRERDEIRASQNDPSEAKLKTPRPGKPKTFVCAIINESDACERLRTYSSSPEGSGSSCSIWEACRATSAASLYFPSITINGRIYWDGGMNSNNPILEVVEEARSVFGQNRAFQTIVSIGTGKGQISYPSSHIFGVVEYAIHRMTDTQQKHTEFTRRYPDLQEQYFRFNEEEELYKTDLADWKKLDRVEKLANDYVASSVGKAKILACA